MSGFPLYDNLIKNLPKKDLTVKEKEQFILNIDNIDLNGQQLLYVLVVVFYQHDISKSDEDDVPYSGFKEKIKKVLDIVFI